MSIEQVMTVEERLNRLEQEIAALTEQVKTLSQVPAASVSVVRTNGYGSTALLAYKDSVIEVLKQCCYAGSIEPLTRQQLAEQGYIWVKMKEVSDALNRANGLKCSTTQNMRTIRSVVPEAAFKVVKLRDETGMQTARCILCQTDTIQKICKL